MELKLAKVSLKNVDAALEYNNKMMEKNSEYTWWCNTKINTIQTILHKKNPIAHGVPTVIQKKKFHKNGLETSLNEKEFVKILNVKFEKSNDNSGDYVNDETSQQHEYAMAIDFIDKENHKMDIFYDQILRYPRDSNNICTDL